MSETTSFSAQDDSALKVAVIGMAGRFPGAPDLDHFWRNLEEGVESIRHWSREELLELGVEAEALEAPGFVPAGAPLDGRDRFDAGFFGYSPGEAEIVDPQQRLFLQCAWHALENAGYAPSRYEGTIGVYASCGLSSYLLNLYNDARVRETISPIELFIGNDKDFLATRTAYKLDLRGPAVNVQTACSSSLVAVHMAAQSLIAGECDMALAGASMLYRQFGYQAAEGSILSPDGHCRAFDARAAGTVPGSGVGAVVLKRLDDALADGDTIDAVILGSAINNDGGLKASFTAPQVDTQAAVIAGAQAAAGVSADTIGYIEAHGTGTALGDPIEIAALTQAFRLDTERRQFCALGSVKPNIGHLDTAAGIAGFIKTVLVLRNGRIPPSLHYEKPNPQIDFAASPFAVNAAARDWAPDTGPRRAGLSSLGIGGTNAHVVLEEAPPRAPVEADETPQLLVVSARDAGALEATGKALAERLESGAGLALADVAFTLREGRHAFAHRQWVVADSPADAAQRLRALTDFGPCPRPGAPGPVFLFPGQGSQLPGMGRDLYEGNPVFRAHFDECAEQLDTLMKTDFRTRLFEGGEEVHRTDIAQPALFAVSFAIAQCWLDIGVRPRALHGHSIGEYVAACLAGVFDLESALALVVERGRVMQAAPAGAMLAVVHPGRDIEDLLEDGLVVAARNAPGLSVLSGDMSAIERARARFEADGTTCRQLATSHAFHSPMMEAAAQALKGALSRVTLNAPRIPVISNVSGTWLSEAEACDPAYWARHLRACVRFDEGMRTLAELPDPVFIETGIGRTLSGLAEQNGVARGAIVEGPRPVGEKGETEGETRSLLAAFGRYWQAGGTIGWSHSARRRRRVPLPPYPFREERYWIETSAAAQPRPRAERGAAREANLLAANWHRAAPAGAAARSGARMLILDDGAIGPVLEKRLERAGVQAYRVLEGTAFEESGYRCFSVRPELADDFTALLEELEERGGAPDHILFLWPAKGGAARVRSLQRLVQALGAREHPLWLTIVTRGGADVTGCEHLAPEQAGLAGLLQVAGQEYPFLTCRRIDIDEGEAGNAALAARRLEAEIFAPEPHVALRGAHRWIETFENERPDLSPTRQRLRDRGVYVLVGNVADGLGPVWSEGIAALSGAKLALLQESTVPPAAPPQGIETRDLRLDCTNAAALEDAFAGIERDWGRINGVFVSLEQASRAATAPLSLLDETHWSHNRAARLAPLEALADVLARRQVGFCCVQSSLSSVVGGLGLGAYAATNQALELFVLAEDRAGQDRIGTAAGDTGTRWFAPAYPAIIMNTAADGDEARDERARLAENPLALMPAEAWDLTVRVIESGISGRTALARGGAAELAEHAGPVREVEKDVAAQTGGRARPDLATPYLAPRNAVEATVAAVFQDLLGLEAIGVDDGFYELGGHSLLAIRAVARLREEFPVDLHLRELLFEKPTVAGIAEAISARMPQQSDLDAMMDLLGQVETLSDDEVSSELTGASAK